MQRMCRLLVALLAFPAATVAQSDPEPAARALWPGFRGPAGIPVSDSDRLPLHWSTTENVEWSVDVPGSGWSSPIVAGDTVLLTTAARSIEATKRPEFGTEYSNEFMRELREQGLPWEEVLKRHDERFIEFPDEVDLDYQLIAWSLEDGAELWKRTFFSGPPPGGRHSKNTFASETPVTDGETIFVYITGLGLWAYSLDGDLRWERRLDQFQIYMDFGTGGSPALTDDLVLILNDNQEHPVPGRLLQAGRARDVARGPWTAGRSACPQPPNLLEHAVRLAARRTHRDRRARPLHRDQLRHDGPGAVAADAALAAAGADALRLRRPALRDLGRPRRPEPPDHRDPPRRQRRPHPGRGRDEQDFVVWNDNRAGTYIPTPVPYKGSLWVVYDRGIFARYDAATGERLYRSRISDSNGHFTTSPWAYRDRIFATDEAGTTFVFGTGEEFEQLHANPLDEMTLASPALAGDRLVMRTRSKLYSIRED